MLSFLLFLLLYYFSSCHGREFTQYERDMAARAAPFYLSDTAKEQWFNLKMNCHNGTGGNSMRVPDLMWWRREPLWDRCAIVSKSGNLRYAGLGPMIDSFDFVVRVSEPFLHGYEHDVGTRTDGVFASMLGYYWSPTHVTHHKPEAPLRNAKLVVVHSKYNGWLHQSWMDTMPQEWLTNTKLCFFDPGVPGIIRRYPRAFPNTTTASTGFLAFLFMHTRCKSVDLFGYGNSECDRAYYYDPPRNSSQHHFHGDTAYDFHGKPLNFKHTHEMDGELAVMALHFPNTTLHFPPCNRTHEFDYLDKKAPEWNE